MSRKVKLPYCSRYVPGEQLKLGWLKALTTNDCFSARYLDWHAHDELEIVFPLRGRYQYEFRKGRTVCADNGCFLVIPGGTEHRLDEAIDPPGFRLHLYLKDPSARPPLNGAFTAAEYARLYQALSKLALRRVPVSSRLKATIIPLGKIINQGAKPLPNGDRLRARFLCNLALCNSADSNTTAGDQSPSHTFAEAVRWLNRNFATPVRLDQLVEHIGYSRARFFALFRQQTGLTPGEYLRNRRLEKAKELLLRSDFPAARIGKVCGFGAPAHFTRLFSKMTGFTPIAYRQQRHTRMSLTSGTRCVAPPHRPNG